MKTKPILFNTEMVQANLEGRKTQTRRTIKGVLDHYEFKSLRTLNRFWDSRVENNPNPLKTASVFINSKPPFNEVTFKSKYQVGDILWVRETFREVMHYGFDYLFYQYKDLSTNAHCEIIDTDQIRHDDKWKPSIFMPKKACRLWLEVTDVRAERLQDISEADAKAEGIEHYWNGLFQEERFKDYSKAKPGKFKPQRFYGQKGNSLGEWREANSSFFSLWESINGKASLDSNSWVWVYTFKRCEMPKDFLS